jgi:hypothetical protein
MCHTILLYGATGYSGQLIAAEAQRAAMNIPPGLPRFRMILAGRDATALTHLGNARQMDHRVFGLGDRTGVRRGLHDVDVVINAAGPFALTAEPLAQGAFDAGCHYMDINGEVDVYKKLDDLGRHAAQINRAMVSGAGHTAAASDLLLHAALTELRSGDPGAAKIELDAVRIALSRVPTLSRGSTDTLWRSLREQVTVVRMGEVDDGNCGMMTTPVLWHEPIGKLERSFDFGDRDPGSGGASSQEGNRRLRIASAANLVDTLTARFTVFRNKFVARRIESYVEIGTVGRIGYQVGALLAPFAAMGWARDLARLQIDMLPAGPTPDERAAQPHTIVLNIEDAFHRTVIDWRWHTPNPYDFTAQVAVEVARQLTATGAIGWSTPSEVLTPTTADLTSTAGYLRGCRLEERR